jgi:hypothetical protein
MKAIVLQSLHKPPWPDWLMLCLTHAKNWAMRAGYDYHFLGDELFDPAPAWFTTACKGQILPQTDLGRLLAMQHALANGYDRVIWLDADVLIFAPGFEITGQVMAREAWISHATDGGYRVARGINNSVMAFDAGGSALPAFIAAILETARGWSGEIPNPRALGPDLLAARPQIRAEACSDAAMFSPMLTMALATGDNAPMRAHAAIWRGPVRAANLCRSLCTDDDLMLAAAETLLANPATATPKPGPAPQDSTPPKHWNIW